ncbi:unnamed protein product [Polarella glacialis]|uniref:Uncharacterized protein n=1 Tax=Polarella glacialis TaxID=89957 RepID=A0A813GC24_POLGL|nr:unnamed protein product [Polarella glacialis]
MHDSRLLIAVFTLLFQARPATGIDLLSTAVNVAAWHNEIKLCRQGSLGQACRWRMNSTDDAPKNFPYLSTSLYYGSPGVAIFLSQVAEATGNSKWREIAAEALEETRDGVAVALSSYGTNAGFYYGLTGLAFGLRAASPTLPHSTEYLAAAVLIEQHVMARVLPFAEASSGAALWNNTDVAHGAAGTGLYLLWAARQEDVSDSHRLLLLDAAARAGQWLLSRQEPVPEGGVRWARGPDTDGEHLHEYFPTFCCGTAGVAYFLLELAQAVASQPALQDELLSTAKQAATHLTLLGKATQPQGFKDIFLLPHGEQGIDRDEFYLGWCGGPPGWARLFVAL